MFKRLILALPIMAMTACADSSLIDLTPQSGTPPEASSAVHSAGKAHAGGAPHWSYAGADGPQNWGSLDASFSTCGTGKSQSPINLTRIIDGKLPPVEFAYQRGGSEILNNGHTVQVNYMPGSWIKVDGKKFDLKQFHFHAPSENTIEGHSYPLEGHFVHADAEGNLAVVAVMYMVESNLGELDKAWKHMPREAGQTKPLPVFVNADALLPRKRGYYRFDGSLTTPPCSEGVRWLVMKTYKEISEKQVKAFTRTIHHPNNRPVQPIHARTVLK